VYDELVQPKPDPRPDPGRRAGLALWLPIDLANRPDPDPHTRMGVQARPEPRPAHSGNQGTGQMTVVGLIILLTIYVTMVWMLRRETDKI
jgi:hypothetical protein